MKYKELYEYAPEKRKEIIAELNRNKKFRIKYFEHNFYSFLLFYFSHMFAHKFSNFHKDWAENLKILRNCFILGFRESAKTLIVFFYLIWVIRYKKKRFILYYSYEKNLSSNKLFEIADLLLTNEKIINDFGYLFPKDGIKKENKGKEKKSIGEFITTNNIKVKSMAITMTSRGQNFITRDGTFRPDLVLFDDIDISKSVRSIELIDKNYDLLENEIMGAIDSECQLIFLGNVIGNDGLCIRWEEKIQENKKWFLSRVAVKDEVGKFTWDRFVETDKEVEEWKKKGVKKVSLEQKKEQQGKTFLANMFLIPTLQSGNPVFDLEEISKINVKEYIEIDKRYKDLFWYQNPIKGNYVSIGVDTRKGVKNGDYSTIVGRDWSGKLLFDYRERMAPDLLVEVLEHIVERTGYNCLIGIENNNTGISTVDAAKNGRLESVLYREIEVDSVTNLPKTKYGFNTNRKTKALIITNFEEVLRKKKIDLSKRCKIEAETYYWDDRGSANALKTKHDDVLVADMICCFLLRQNNPNFKIV